MSRLNAPRPAGNRAAGGTGVLGSNPFNRDHITIVKPRNYFRPFLELLGQARDRNRRAADAHHRRVGAQLYWSLVGFVRRRHGRNLHGECER